MILYQLLAKELICKCYAEDTRSNEAYLLYGVAKKHLGSRFHIPRKFQAGVIRDLVAYDLARNVSKDILCIKTDKIN